MTAAERDARRPYLTQVSRGWWDDASYAAHQGDPLGAEMERETEDAVPYTPLLGYDKANAIEAEADTDLPF